MSLETTLYGLPEKNLREAYFNYVTRPAMVNEILAKFESTGLAPEGLSDESNLPKTQ